MLARALLALVMVAASSACTGSAATTSTTLPDGRLDCSTPEIVTGSVEIGEGYAGLPTRAEAAKQTQHALDMDDATLASISDQRFALLVDGREVAVIQTHEAPAGGEYTQLTRACQT